MKRLLYLGAGAAFIFAGAPVMAQGDNPANGTGSIPNAVRPMPDMVPIGRRSRNRPRDTQNMVQGSSSDTARQNANDVGNPDVLLDVQNLSVDSITLDVNDLRVRLSLEAQALNLVHLTAGADVGIQRVHLGVQGVRAQALLRVHLDKVAHIVDRTMQTIDRNPQLLNRLMQTVDNTVGTVGNVANTALQPGGVLSQTVNTLGQTVNHTLDATGNIVEKTLDTTGKVLNSKTVGSILKLPVLSETTNDAGQTVRRVRDNSGAVIEYTLDKAGKILNSHVVNPAAGAGTGGAGSPDATQPGNGTGGAP